MLASLKDFPVFFTGYNPVKKTDKWESKPWRGAIDQFPVPATEHQ